MGLLDFFRLNHAPQKKAWSEPPFWTTDHLMSQLGLFSPGTSDKERIETNFESYVQGAYKRNGPIFSCMQARATVFSEARFMWRRFARGRPGDLYGTPELALLENPWPGGTTGELLTHMIQDADLAGNFYATVTDDRGRYGRKATGPGRRIVRMRPDWVTLLLGSNSGDVMALDTKVTGYLYEPRRSPGSPSSNEASIILQPDDVCHFSPIPDPAQRFVGMSWMTPVLREIEADSSATLHKRTFFENAAVPNMVVKFDRDTSEDAFQEFVEKFKENHQGAWKAYKTLFLMGGADVTPLTHDFRQLDFSQTVGKGESRIAAASGVPSSWVGFSEGLQGSALNAGNFAAARRRFADGTIRPLWRQAAAALQRLVPPPNGNAQLWFDDRDIAFLREDNKDRAEIFTKEMSTIASGIMQGFQPDAMVQATRDYDVDKLLGQHTGLVSVQMRSARVPDENFEQVQDKTNLLAGQASIVAALVGTGRFTEESVVAAVESMDLSKLVAAPQEPVEPGQEPEGGQAPKPRQSATGGDRGVGASRDRERDSTDNN